MEGSGMSVEEKLLRTRFVVDHERPHILVKDELCLDCHRLSCINICPAQCYRKEGPNVRVSWENCVECGSCRLVCPRGAISWDYPRGGFGVCYRYG